MRHVRSLDFDGLETRKLMTKAHAAHPAVPLVLDGTLAVDQKAATTTTDYAGDTLKATPVSGVLGGVGKVKGVWNEGADYYGDSLGPDTIQLHNPQGTFVISFDTAKLGKVHRTPQGGYFDGLPQQVHGGTGAYARATESGSIVVNTNAARTSAQSLTLSTGKA
jgi:hypothetical protein